MNVNFIKKLCETVYNIVNLITFKLTKVLFGNHQSAYIKTAVEMTILFSLPQTYHKNITIKEDYFRKVPTSQYNRNDEKDFYDQPLENYSFESKNKNVFMTENKSIYVNKKSWLSSYGQFYFMINEVS